LYREELGEWRISGIIDRSIIEIFLNEGELGASSVFFPNSPLDTMVLRIGGINESATASVGVWGLKAVWEEMGDVNGTVLGNVTEVAGNATNRLL